MNDLWHGTIRHAFTTIIVALAAVAAFFIIAHRLFPPNQPIHSAVSVVTPPPLTRETQAMIDALALNAAKTSGVSPLIQPAVTVVEKSGVVSGLTPAQVAQILGALKPKTVEKVAVGSKLVGPSPAPRPSVAPGLTQAQLDAIGAADRAALTEVLADPNTKIVTEVTISQQEVAPSRVGSVISAYGSGLSYAALRHKQYEVDIAAVLRSAHLSPGACFTYLVPHAQLSIGPCLFYEHNLQAGAAAIVHF